MSHPSSLLLTPALSTRLFTARNKRFVLAVEHRGILEVSVSLPSRSLFVRDLSPKSCDCPKDQSDDGKTAVFHTETAAKDQLWYSQFFPKSQEEVRTSIPGVRDDVSLPMCSSTSVGGVSEASDASSSSTSSRRLRVRSMNR